MGLCMDMERCDKPHGHSGPHRVVDVVEVLDDAVEGNDIPVEDEDEDNGYEGRVPLMGLFKGK